MTKTYSQKTADVVRYWQLVDAQGQILGRMATQIAIKLMGKHRPTFTPHIDSGDYVLVINAALIKVTGQKLSDKIYSRHSGYPGGLSQQTLGQLLADHPEKVVYQAVYNMLPKNRLRSDRMNRLKIYPGVDHPHQSQIGQSVGKE